MTRPTEHTMPWQLHRSSQGRDWHVDLDVTFKVEVQRTEEGKWAEVTVLDVKAENGQPFEPYPERNEIVKNGYISQLHEDEEFYEMALEHANAQTDPLADPRIP